MNIAELFDTAIAALEAQPGKAQDPKTGLCKYRLNGLSCLFGHMISDDYYYPDLETETNGVGGYEVSMAITRSTGINLLEHLKPENLTYIQQLHDSTWEQGEPFRPLLPGPLQIKIWGEIQS